MLVQKVTTTGLSRSILVGSFVIAASSAGLGGCGEGAEPAGEGSASDDGTGGESAESSGGSGLGGVGAMGSSVGGSVGADGGTSSGGSTSGGIPEDATPLLVMVGNWGLRASAPLHDEAGGGTEWTVCGNASTGNDHSPDLLRAVAFGAGVFVAVGGDANSMVMRSVDGIHWQEDLHPTNACDDESYPASCENWKGGVAYGDGVWLSGGGNGSLMRSTDGALSWEGLHPDPSLPAVRGVAFAEGRFYVGCDGGVVGVSTDDGASFTQHDLWDHSLGVTAAGAVVFARGSHWNGSGFDRGCFISTDAGDSFESCPSELEGALGVSHGGGTWAVRVGSGYSLSTDGETWSSVLTADPAPDRLVWAEDKWWGIDGDTLYAGETVDGLALVATDLPSYRALALGWVDPASLPVDGVMACEDNR